MLYCIDLIGYFICVLAMMTQGSLPEGSTAGGLIMAMIALESAGVAGGDKAR